MAQLAMPSLDFAKEETQFLILQTIHQAGPTNGHVERMSHGVLTDVSFCEILLEQLGVASRARSENWESWRASANFSLIARRILSLNSSSVVINACLHFNEEIRQLCTQWNLMLRERITSSTNDLQRKDLHLKATEVALLCISTFDVDDRFADSILEHSDAVTLLIQSSIQVRDNIDVLQKDPGCLHGYLLQAWGSLMYRISSRLQRKVYQNRTILDRAVSASWAGFDSTVGGVWNILPAPRQHWFHTVSGNLSVHLNLLTAELLVDGAPLTRLPPEYVQHPVYDTLFHGCLMEVGPTNEPGFVFSSKFRYLGYSLHFGLNGRDMLVLAVRNGVR